MLRFQIKVGFRIFLILGIAPCLLQTRRSGLYLLFWSLRFFSYNIHSRTDCALAVFSVFCCLIFCVPILSSRLPPISSATILSTILGIILSVWGETIIYLWVKDWGDNAWYSFVLLRPKHEVKFLTQSAEKWICMGNGLYQIGGIKFTPLSCSPVYRIFFSPTRTVP